MANRFAIILVIATLITGIFWCLNYFKLSSWGRLRQRHNKQRADRASMIADVATVKASNKLNMKLEKLKLTETCASIFPVLLFVLLVRSFIFEPFQIPSGSMMPALLAGDFILVEKFAYGIKDPITQKTLIETGHPKRGDVVVFKYPLNPSLDYIKRVVGLPGDQISYDPIGKRLTVRPNYTSEQDNLTVTYSDISPSDYVQIFNSTKGYDARNIFLHLPPDKQVAGGIRLTQHKESLGDVLYNILTVPGQQDQLSIYFQQSGQPLAEWVVPQGKYFMMGDNRDNSADSRYWGFVPEKNLVGKATVIWMSFNKREGKCLPTSVRLNRIGGIN